MAEVRSAKGPNTRRRILVTGATGKQGGAVVRHLRRRGFPVRALTRDPQKPEARALIGEGAEVFRGDYDDAASLRNAMDEVYGVFSMQTPFDRGIEAEIRQGRALADAAQRSHISHFVYSSVAGADRNTGIPHFDSKWQIEQHLRGLGMPFTILRPVFFMENWLGMAGIIKSGTLAQPLTPDRKLAQIAVDDIGMCAALVFEHSGKYQGQAIELAGDDRSMSDMAALFSRVLNREVHYVQVPWDEFEQRTGHEIAVMYRWFQDVGYQVDIPALRQQFPHLTRLENWAQQQNWQAAGAAQTRRAG